MIRHRSGMKHSCEIISVCSKYQQLFWIKFGIPTFHNLIINNEGSMARMQTASGLKIARHSSGRNPDLIFNLTVNVVSLVTANQESPPHHQRGYSRANHSSDRAQPSKTKVARSSG